jgi:hypothetical protein
MWAGRVLLSVAVVALVACGGEGGAADDTGVTVLAKADGWRDGVAEAGEHPYALLEIAADEAAAHEAWEANVPADLPVGDGAPEQPGVYRDLADVDLDGRALVVFHSGQSSSCPVWVEAIATFDDRVEVELGREPAEACTDDFQTYRMVLAVDQDLLPAPGELPVERVDVPSENLTDVNGRVVTYPVG